MRTDKANFTIIIYNLHLNTTFQEGEIMYCDARYGEDTRNWRKLPQVEIFVLVHVPDTPLVHLKSSFTNF